MRSKHRLLIAATAAVLGLAVVVAASARPASRLRATAAWSRISGPKEAGQELGLARTSDGVLNVIWNRGNGPTTILDTRLSIAGAPLGTTTVATNWGGAEGLALLVMPDGTLRLFATGSPVNGSPVGGVNTLTAQSNGSGWSLQQGAVWGGPVAAAASIIGATLTKDGQPVTAWDGWVNVGLSANYPQNALYPDMLSGAVVTDGASGAIVFAAETISKAGGTFVQQALPSLGPAVVLPSSTQSQGVSGVSARIGAPGVYVAYTDTTRSGVTKPAVRLYRYAGPTRTMARGQFTTAKVFPGPAGRLWVVWADAKDGVFVTRSNEAASRFGAAQRLKLPADTGFVWNAQGEGSAGPLDLFVDVGNNAGSDRGFWHMHVLARLSASASAARTRGKPSTVTVHVTDVGDPVVGATVQVGGQSRTTDATGKASFTLAANHAYRGTVSANGYQKAALTVHS
jgi:hypothetical protein